MFIRSDNTAMICAWCVPTDAEKKAVNDWAEQNGHDVSHGICAEHKKKFLEETLPVPTTTEILQANSEMQYQELLAKLNGETKT